MEAVITNNDSSKLQKVGDSPNSGMYAGTTHKYSSSSMYNESNTYHIYSSTLLVTASEYIGHHQQPYGPPRIYGSDMTLIYEFPKNHLITNIELAEWISRSYYKYWAYNGKGGRSSWNASQLRYNYTIHYWNGSSWIDVSNPTQTISPKLGDLYVNARGYGGSYSQYDAPEQIQINYNIKYHKFNKSTNAIKIVAKKTGSSMHFAFPIIRAKVEQIHHMKINNKFLVWKNGTVSLGTSGEKVSFIKKTHSNGSEHYFFTKPVWIHIGSHQYVDGIGQIAMFNFIVKGGTELKDTFQDPSSKTEMSVNTHKLRFMKTNNGVVLYANNARIYTQIEGDKLMIIGTAGMYERYGGRATPAIQGDFVQGKTGPSAEDLLKDLNDKNKKTQEDLDKAKGDLSNANNKLNDALGDINKLKSDLANERNAANRALDVEKAKASQLQAQLNLYKTQTNNTISGLNANVTTLTNERNSYKKQLAALRSSSEAMNKTNAKKIADLTSKLQKTDATLLQTQTEKDAMEKEKNEKIAQLEQELKETEDKLKKAEEKIRQIEAENQRLLSEIEKKKQRIIELTESARQDSEAKQARIDALNELKKLSARAYVNLTKQKLATDEALSTAQTENMKLIDILKQVDDELVGSDSSTGKNPYDLVYEFMESKIVQFVSVSNVFRKEEDTEFTILKVELFNDNFEKLAGQYRNKLPTTRQATFQINFPKNIENVKYVRVSAFGPEGTTPLIKEIGIYGTDGTGYMMNESVDAATTDAARLKRRTTTERNYDDDYSLLYRQGMMPRMQEGMNLSPPVMYPDYSVKVKKPALKQMEPDEKEYLYDVDQTMISTSKQHPVLSPLSYKKKRDACDLDPLYPANYYGQTGRDRFDIRMKEFIQKKDPVITIRSDEPTTINDFNAEFEASGTNNNTDAMVGNRFVQAGELPSTERPPSDSGFLRLPEIEESTTPVTIERSPTTAAPITKAPTLFEL